MKKDYLLIYFLFLLFSSVFLFSSIVQANDIRLGSNLNASIAYFSDMLTWAQGFCHRLI